MADAEKGSVSKRGGTSSSSSVLISSDVLLGFQSQMTAPVELSQCWIKTNPLRISIREADLRSDRSDVPGMLLNLDLMIFEYCVLK